MLKGRLELPEIPMSIPDVRVSGGTPVDMHSTTVGQRLFVMWERFDILIGKGQQNGQCRVLKSPSSRCWRRIILQILPRHFQSPVDFTDQPKVI